MSYTLHMGDALTVLKTLPENSIHCVITSPPYYGLREYGVEGQIGIEETPELYVKGLIHIFREIRRLLRPDGVLWLNLGDSYTGFKRKNAGEKLKNLMAYKVKRKEIYGMPWRVALALQEDGWHLRQDIIWKKLNPLPESVTDRCTKAHEYIFLLTKSEKYFYDSRAIMEPASPKTKERDRYGYNSAFKNQFKGHPTDERHQEGRVLNAPNFYKDGLRNKHSVWTVPTNSYKSAHFATFPPDLIRPCVLAGTSEYGCCFNCGAPYYRIVDARKTKWQKKCCCETEELTTAKILDPFAGSGTTGLVAIEHGRDAVLIELHPEYCKIIESRLKTVQKKLF